MSNASSFVLVEEREDKVDEYREPPTQRFFVFFFFFDDDERGRRRPPPRTFTKRHKKKKSFTSFEVFGSDLSSSAQYPDVPRERVHWVETDKQLNVLVEEIQP